MDFDFAEPVTPRAPGYGNSVSGKNGVKLIDVTSAGDTIESAGDIELDGVELRGRTYVSSAATVRGRDVIVTGIASLSGRNVTLRRATSEPSTSIVRGSPSPRDADSGSSTRA